MAFSRQIFEEQDVITILFHLQHEAPKDTAILLEYAFQLGRATNVNGRIKEIQTPEQLFQYLNKKLNP